MSAERRGRTSETPAVRLRRLVDEHFDAIHRAVRRFGVQPSLADDGAQQVFLVVASKLSTIELASERAFLFGTAFRVARELRRRTGDVSRSAEAEQALSRKADSSPNLEDLVDRKRARLVLDELLVELPDDLRAVFVLYEIEELTVPEIAEALELAPGTAASRLRRARASFEQAVARFRAKDSFSRKEQAIGVARPEGAP